MEINEAKTRITRTEHEIEKLLQKLTDDTDIIIGDIYIDQDAVSFVGSIRINATI